MPKLISTCALVVIPLVLSGCAAFAVGAALTIGAPLVAGIAIEASNTVYVDGTRVRFLQNNPRVHKCRTLYGLSYNRPDGLRFGCSAVEFSPNRERSFEERLELARRAVDAKPNFTWFIEDADEIQRVTDNLYPDNASRDLIVIAYIKNR